VTKNAHRKVAVLGGGIAGLAAALAFRQKGADVSVFEQATELKEVGAGLQITPNGAAVLRGLGLERQAAARGLSALAVVPTDALTGRAVARFDLTYLDGPPYRYFHRADLLAILADGCEAAGVTIRTSAKVEEVRDDGSFTLANGQTHSADIVIGADGIKSRARPSINGPDAPFFTGQVAWRSVIDLPDAAHESRIWMAPGRHVVTYPLIGGRLNIVAVQERKDWAAEGWDFFDSPEVVQAAFSDCAPALRDILDRIETVRLWGLFRHPVADKWHQGNRVIIGDAAHPTLPFLAQGANLALEDAWALAAACGRETDLGSAFAQFEAARKPRVTRAITTANDNAVNYHLSGTRRAVAHAALTTLGHVAPRAFLRRLDWLYGFDVTTA